MISYLLVAIIAYFLGWFSHEIYKLLLHIRDNLPLVKKEPEVIENSFAEPLTALELAAQQEHERIKALNPGYDE